LERRPAQERAGAREPGGRLLAIRVRVGLTANAEGRLAQLEQVAKKVEACPKAGGAGLSDIVETRTYVADPDQLAKYADIRKQYFGSASPARTILKEGGLSDPDNLVEVMAFAAIQ
jgi:enamine deaminase RidA (YjgF/YER057c/UK114 family)